jgi:hypothetical protein
MDEAGTPLETRETVIAVAILPAPMTAMRDVFLLTVFFML